MADFARKIQIKTGVCTRLQKEVLSYRNEAAKQAEKIQKMRDDNADPYDIKKQEEVLAESNTMIPDSTKRLDAALKDLQALLASVETSNQAEAIKQSDNWTAAQNALQSGTAFLFA